MKDEKTMINIQERQRATQTSPRRSMAVRLSRALQSTFHWIACFVVLTAVIGCGSQDGHHEDEHLEHFVPAHKPGNFTALVEQLEKRIDQQSQTPGSDEGAAAEDQSATERQELIDILGWIPELAADSEMRKQEFEMAVSAGARLGVALGLEKSANETAAADRSSIPQLLKELKALISKSQTSTEPM